MLRNDIGQGNDMVVLGIACMVYDALGTLMVDEEVMLVLCGVDGAY